jgi:hypothetical protein
MPALPNVTDVLRVELKWSIGSDTSIFTRLHFSFAGTGPTPTDCLTIAGDIGTSWVSDLKPLVFTGNELTSIRVTDLTTSSAGDATLPVTDNGSRTGSFLPAGACLLGNYEISRRYRGGKPRSYWPFGVQGDMQTGQTWTTSFQSAATTGVVNFFAAVSLITWGSSNITGPVNVSYYDGFTVVTDPVTGRARNKPKPRTTPLVDPINAETVNPVIAYQRRRSAR